MSASFASLNWLAIILATVSAFVIGGAWYSPALFGKQWQRLIGLSDEELKRGSPAKIFGGAFVLTLFAAFNLAMFIGPESPQSTFGFAVMAGFLTGFGWVAMAYGVTYLFERRPTAVWLINAGYWVVALTVMGAIIGWLR